METNKSSALTFHHKLLFVILFVFSALIAIASSSNELRTYVFEKINKRQVIAKVFQQFNETDYVIFKIKTSSGIEVEIYEKSMTDSSQKLKQKFSFENDLDSSLLVEGNAVNLGLSDVDRDGNNEIIIPTVDQYGLSRLNIIRFDSELNSFVPSIENN